ncbi:late histone H1-like [Episyrphus balteatus]|uniref:late histone H1-like n=1 Tax=Episyrphus balteatus TaxID=286459 RepID=UPI0024869F7F|nr:late histone H1-like [Episyrphus balteatus]
MPKTNTSSSAINADKKSMKPSATHPPTKQMVDTAIGAMKERKGSSVQAIKKYIAANYLVDVEKHSRFIKNYLKSAVINGNLIQTKGQGAVGSFKLPKVVANKKPNTKSTDKGAPVKKRSLVKPKTSDILKANYKSKGDTEIKSGGNKKVATKSKVAAKQSVASKQKAGAAAKSKTAQVSDKALTKKTGEKKGNKPVNVSRKTPQKKNVDKPKAGTRGNRNSNMWLTDEQANEMKKKAKLTKSKPKRGGNGNRYIWCTKEEWENKYKYQVW